MSQWSSYKVDTLSELTCYVTAVERCPTGVEVDEGNQHMLALIIYRVLTYFLETRVSILRWLSELDFWQIHEQHVVEREEGTGEISSRLEPEFAYWMNAEQGYVWLQGDREPLPATCRFDNALANYEFQRGRASLRWCEWETSA